MHVVISYNLPTIVACISGTEMLVVRHRWLECCQESCRYRE